MKEEFLYYLSTTHKPQIMGMGGTEMLANHWYNPLSYVWNIGGQIINNIMNRGYHAVVVFDYRENGSGGEFLINDTWDVSTPATVKYNDTSGGFDVFDSPSVLVDFVEFEFLPSEILYDNSTFTGGNYPNP